MEAVSASSVCCRRRIEFSARADSATHKPPSVTVSPSQNRPPALPGLGLTFSSSLSAVKTACRPAQRQQLAFSAGEPTSQPLDGLGASGPFSLWQSTLKPVRLLAEPSSQQIVRRRTNLSALTTFPPLLHHLGRAAAATARSPNLNIPTRKHRQPPRPSTLVNAKENLHPSPKHVAQIITPVLRQSGPGKPLSALRPLVTPERPHVLAPLAAVRAENLLLLLRPVGVEGGAAGGKWWLVAGAASPACGGCCGGWWGVHAGLWGGDCAGRAGKERKVGLLDMAALTMVLRDNRDVSSLSWLRQEFTSSMPGRCWTFSKPKIDNKVSVDVRNGSAALWVWEIGAMSQSAHMGKTQYLSISHIRLSLSDISFSISCSAVFMAR